MKKTILITGSTDGIGLEAAKMLVSQGHTMLLHGRTPSKLEAVVRELSALPNAGKIESYVADLSRMPDVEAMAAAISERHTSLDVLINNAGVFKTPTPRTDEGLDIRFAVNTIAPYLLTQRLLPLLGETSRVVNLSSAAQAPVNLGSLAGDGHLPDGAAYAQSKLAITMWSNNMAAKHSDGPVFIALNPGSLLATKMVKEGFGVAGADISIGAKIITQAAVDDMFQDASGQYFDNDSHRFAPPHSDALDPQKNEAVVRVIESVLARG